MNTQTGSSLEGGSYGPQVIKPPYVQGNTTNELTKVNSRVAEINGFSCKSDISLLKGDMGGTLYFSIPGILDDVKVSYKITVTLSGKNGAYDEIDIEMSACKAVVEEYSEILKIYKSKIDSKIREAYFGDD